MAQTPTRNHAPRGHHKQYARMLPPNLQRHVVPTAVLTQSKLVSITAARPVNIVVPKITVTRPREAKTVVTKPNSPPKRHINRSPSPKANTFPPKVTAVKAPMVNVAKDKGVIDSGCSRCMTGNMSYLFYFEEVNSGYVAFGGNPNGGKISGKLPDENQVLLRVPRENNMYNVDLKNIVPSRDLTCLFAKATLDESNLWHRRLGHINFKTMNKLVKGNLIRGLLTKVFQNNHTCVACKKGKQHRASCKTKPVSSVNQPLQRLHIDLFGPTFVKILNKKSYCLVVIDDYSREEIIQQYVLFPVWSSGSTIPHNTDGDASFDEKEPEFEGMKPESEVNVSPSSSAQSKKHDDKTRREAKGKSPVESLTGYRNLSADFKDFSDNSINEDNAASTLVHAIRKIFTNSTNTFSAAGPSNDVVSPTHGKSSYVDSSQLPNDPNMPELEDITYSGDKDNVGAETDFNNLETSIIVSPIPTTRVHKDHHVTQLIGDLSSATQTRKEPKRVHQAFKDPSWIEAMQEELLQFKMQMAWVLVDFPHGKRAICTKWVFRFKKDERGIVVRNKARLVTQGHTQEEGIDYEEVFTPVARIEAIRLFLAYASFMGFMVYQMDVKSAFMYGTIEEEVYVCQPLGFEDPDYPDKKKYGIFINQDKYVAEILRKFSLTEGKSASTPIDTEKPLLKDPDGEDVDVHTYRSMIGSLMYLPSSRPDIMFAVCACACFQVTPKASHLHAVKRIFRYLKGKPHLGLWYPKDSPFNLVAYSDSDYAGASLDRKSTTEGCQFFECRLISWQCKKKTIMATSSPSDNNFADLLTKAFDVGRFQYLVASIGLLNP
nr:ribonuclease H-like domain-containing protein [Tanacetum cinerariifolium]